MTLKEYESKRVEYYHRIEVAKNDHKRQIKLIQELIIFIFDTYKLGLVERRQMGMSITAAILPATLDLEEDPEVAEVVSFLDEKILAHSGSLELPEDVYIGNIANDLAVLEKNISLLRDQLSGKEN